MIDGLKCIVNGDELWDLCVKRGKELEDTCEKYGLEVSRLLEIGESDDAVTALGNEIDRLQDEIIELEFIEDHINTHQTYLLGRDDLVRLGIAKSRY